MRDNHTTNLFAPEVLAPGFRYQADIISEDDERALLHPIKDLPFREFEFQGFTAKRRVVSFDWRYDFN